MLDICRDLGIRTATFYKWWANYDGMDVSMMSRMKELEDENRRLKKNMGGLPGVCHHRVVLPIRAHARCSERRGFTWNHKRVCNHPKTPVFMRVLVGIEGQISAYSSIYERYNLEINSPSAPKVARSPLTSSQNLDLTNSGIPTSVMIQEKMPASGVIE